MSVSSKDGVSAMDIPSDAVAVVGMACKFPGAETLDEYWSILDAGESMLKDPPNNHLPTHNHPRSTEKSVFHSNFLKDNSSFDNRFFKKSSREAASMDPQQRLLLEVSYQALESSGFFGPRQPDLDVGCYIGVCASDYNDNVASHPPNAFSALGTLRAFAPGRVSHFFGLRGPSIALDTACSSSAVAIDAACKAILHGDCRSAIAGGVSVFSSPFFYQNLAAASFLSPTGASKSFDARADGYCRGEGVGLVVLKRLADAISDGDTVLGTILATSVRQSSNKVPITVPYSSSQTALYRKLLDSAGIVAEDVTFVEAHGTGTPVGDPLEYEAIKEVFAKKPRQEPLYFASVKGNIGHTEGASGVAGLIKTILMMQNRSIPRQANFVSPHPKISLVPGRIAIPTATIPWTADRMIACVNNYGAAGSIAAMLVSEPPRKSVKQIHGRLHEKVQYPLLITGNSPKSLGDNCASVRDYALSMSSKVGSSENIIADLTFNLSDRQNRALPYMFTTTISNLSELDEQLRTAAFNPNSSLYQNNLKPNPTVLVFGGQIGRSVDLSKHVFESSGLLQKYLDQCDGILKGLGSRGIYPDIFENKQADDVVMLQTMQFSLQYACAQSWIACGLNVDCIVGHSFGQLVALTVSGVLSLADGLKFVHGRAVLMRERWGSEKGSMVAIEADRADIEALVASVRGVEVACFNGPRSQVLVGSSSDISNVVAAMTKSSMSAKAKILDVTHGFHSRFCDPILPELERLANGLTFNQPRIHLETSSVNGTWPIATSKLLADHTRSPVYFEDAVKRIEQRFGSCTWLEAGSNTLVTNMARRALNDQKEKMSSHVFFPINLSRDGALGALAETTTNLWKQGHHVQYWPFHHQNGGSYQVMNLPPYQFEKAQHWLDFDFPSAAAPEPVQDKLDASQVETVKSEPEPEPELISFAGFGDADAAHEGQKRAIFIIDPRVEEWKALVSGHSVLQEPLCPAPLYIELVLQAAKQLAAIQNIPSVPFSRVEDLEMPSPLGMSQDKIIQLVFTPTDHTGCKYTFSFHAQPRHANSRKEALFSIPKGATTHASGKVEILLTNDNTVTSEFERTRKLLERMRPDQNEVGDASSQAVSGPLVYKLFSSVVQYHDFYQCVRSLNSTGDGSVLAHVSQPQSGPSCIQSLLSMPLAIDNFFQVPGIYANCLAPCPSSEVFVSTHVDRIQISPDFANLRAEENGQGWDVFAMSTALNDKEITNDIFVTEKATGKLIFIAFGAKFTRVRIAALAKILSRANSGEVAPSTAAKLPPKARVEFVQAAPTVPQVQRAVPVVSSETPQHTATPVPQQQPKQHPSTNGSVSLAPPVSIIPAPSTAIPRKSRVEGDLREMLSKMTDVPADDIKDDILLIDLGVDSLMATEVLSDIQKIFNISISPDLLQELQTFASLRRYLDGQMSGPESDNHLPVVVPWQTPIVPAVSPNATLAPEIASQEAEVDDRTEKSSVEYESSTRDSDQEQDLTARLADLLSTHLEVPVDELVASPNLVDLGLDSLLCMELMSDIDKDLGVSIDLSDLTGDVNFGHLVDKLVGELRTTKTTTSSTPKSTNTFSSGVSTPLTSSQSGSDDERDVMPTKTQAPRISMNGPLASAADAFESIKGDYDEQAKHYKFIDFYTSVYGKQSELVLAYVVEAFLDLGVDLKTLRAGDRIPAISTVPKHGRMIDVFHRILHQAKVADYNGEAYFRSEVPINLAHSSVLSREIIAEFPQHAKEHMLLDLCGPNLAKFLTGTMDPLAVLFGNKANRTIVEDVYAEAPMFVIMSQLLTSFLEKTLSTSTPGPNGKFKIVELGAGTGATTRCVVDRLVQRGIPIEYTFTDISPSLVLGSKRKFTKFDCMKFGTIDIEKEPPAEYLGQFDIVLATNCIHATSSLPNSLANINKLLRPHGFVSLVELTTRNFWLDLVFGLLDGWWLYDDNRPYVLATPEFWDHTMRDKGFQHVSWTGGHSRESEAVRVITGFKQPVQDPSSYKSTPQGVNGGTETVVFKHTDKRLPLRADVYYPSASQATVHKTWVPGLLVHGGGHVMLSRQDLRPRQIQLLLDNGVLPVAVDYRLCPETTILEGPLVDVNDAYVWLRKALPSLKLMQTDINKKLDSTRAVVIGWSTGGTLAMSLSWTSLPRGISPPDAILAFYCPTDYQDEFWTKPNIPEHSDAFAKEKYNVIEGVFPSPITAYNVPPTTGSAAGWIAPKDKRSRVVLHMNWYGQTLPVLFKGLPSASAVATHDAAQFNHLEQPPVEDIVKASPYAQIIRGNYRSPTHVIFGTGDDLIPWKQAQRTVDAMRESGIDCGLTLAPDQPHLFDMYRDSDGSRWGYVMEGYNFLFSRIGRGEA
ncbi:hypothetical protein PFICI_00366 [Pestalotiopsis fici W106-1]|uniref:Uncharacterized protein n=1 Tax=Pestalotiopsis fici (strain W106-1 / CGMCC3.15140) TaxID=1229662 RepID=W3XKG0_PESFW|nr:uncharacterized protein PFICI_00366 [Pestalotiopsis fici W106-1]ETS86538.1 hypothetical protein PFICI_00366 [Pestalotiopsis fici W106-1]